MPSSQLRKVISQYGRNSNTTSLCRLTGRRSIVVPATSVLSSSASSSSTSSLSSKTNKQPKRSLTNVSYDKLDIKSLQERGVMDENQLVAFNTLHNMQVHACEAFNNNDLFGTYQPKLDEKTGEDLGGNFEWMSFTDWGNKVNQCRAVLKNLGVDQYTKVGIISNNRWEWATIAQATYSLNGTLVPMYEAQLPSDWTYILNDSGSTVLFCATQDIYARVHSEVLANTPHVKNVLCLDASDGEPHAFATAMSSIGTNNNNSDGDGILLDPVPVINPPTQDDLANLVYTSGTTGKPKGVELTHLNSCSNIKAAVRSLVNDPKEFCRETDRSLAFLPWAHSYGQTCELWASVAHGSSMGICRGVPVILEDLQMVKPTVLFAVPTLYKKIYDGVNNTMETSSPLRKKLMKGALEIGKKKTDLESNGKSLGFVDSMKFKVLDSLVSSKIRARFGGNLRHAFAGGAACPAEVTDFLDAIGIKLFEGYGLTETAPIITLNTPDYRKAGTVGVPLGPNKVYIINPDDGKTQVPDGEEGEICTSGPNVMRGYYNNREATDEVISIAPDGKSRMFHTGDLGRLDSNGYLMVTGRIKEQYKLENGKYVVPTPIEESIGLSRFISQVVLCGANRPHNSALIVPDFVAIRNELKIEETTTDDDMVNDERVKALIDAEIGTACKDMKKYEIPTKWSFVAPFTAANNMLTPKMSIRRHVVIKTYEDLIGSFYGDPIVTEAADGVIHENEQQQQKAA